MKLRDARLADAELGAEILELHTAEVMLRDDVTFALWQLFHGLGQGLLSEFGGDRSFAAGSIGEATVLLPLAHVIEADHCGWRTVGIGAAGGFGGGPSAARQPILGAQLIEDRAADAHTHVPLEALTRTVGVTTNRVPQAAHAGRDQILTQHVARQLALEAAGNLADERFVLKKELGAQLRVEAASFFDARGTSDDRCRRGSDRAMRSAGGR